MPVLLSVLPRPRLPKLVSPVLPLAQVLGPMEITVTPPLYDYLAFPSHERLPFALQTREGKVVRLPDWLILGSVLVAPSIDSADPRAVYQRIAHDLRTQILSGDLPPGSALPSETELVRRYGSSRGPVRQAISLLRSEGLIDSHQGRGVFVRQRPTTRRLSIEGVADRTNGALDSVEDVDGRLEVLRYTPTTAPTLVLAGDQDPGLTDLRATADSIPGARLTVLPGCGHLDTFTRSDLTLPVVVPFLTETLAETPT
jgi:DNA-binding transcriptional regulator YhcF (GntR family)